ncbi:MAG: hypothetical protein ACK56I_07980, partial [bacterium]
DKGEQMTIVPGAGYHLFVGTTKAAYKIGVRKRAEEALAKFLLGKKFKSIAITLSVGTYSFVTNRVKITA